MANAVKPAAVTERGLLSAIGARSTYSYLAEGTTLGANVLLIDVFNAATSGYVVYVENIQPINVAVAAITGTAERFNVYRTTAVGTAGTALTAVSQDTRSPVLSTDITARRGATGGATQSDLIYPFALGTDEVQPSNVGADHAQNRYSPASHFPFMEPIVCNPGEGIVVKQTTAGVAGNVAFLVTISVLPDNS